MKRKITVEIKVSEHGECSWACPTCNDSLIKCPFLDSSDDFCIAFKEGLCF